MGWLISLILTIVASVVREWIILVAAGLFAIAGSIELLDRGGRNDK